MVDSQKTFGKFSEEAEDEVATAKTFGGCRQFEAIIAEQIPQFSEKNQDFSEKSEKEKYSEKNSKSLSDVVDQCQNGVGVDSVVENSVWVSAKMLTAT